MLTDFFTVPQTLLWIGCEIHIILYYNAFYSMQARGTTRAQISLKGLTSQGVLHFLINVFIVGTGYHGYMSPTGNEALSGSGMIRAEQYVQKYLFIIRCVYSQKSTSNDSTHIE